MSRPCDVYRRILLDQVLLLYTKPKAPNLKYLSGSQDESTNERFLKRMDFYLFQNYQVRRVLLSELPHPFSQYPRLKQYYAVQGKPAWTFDCTTTYAVLKEIKVNGHMDFYQEMSDLLWFGDTISYGNIIHQTYAIMYAWIDPQALPDLNGLCEENDGVTFRKVIRDSLRIVRSQHKQALISREYDKIRTLKLVMKPRGMTAFSAKMNKYRLKLKKYGDTVSDTFLLHQAYTSIRGRHAELNKAIADMRKKSDTSGIPTTFIEVKEHLIDIFDFEVPSTSKTETAPASTISANQAGSDPGPDKRGWSAANDYDNDNNPRKRIRRTFPKGSCKYCPESTNHETATCYMTTRKKMGLPKGWQWCLYHKKGTHYEHKCKRHAPNFPPAPTAKACLACPEQPGRSSSTLHNQNAGRLVQRIMGMVASHLPPQLPQKSGSSVRITPPEGRTLNFQTVHGIPTNVARNGPPVSQIVNQPAR